MASYGHFFEALATLTAFGFRLRVVCVLHASEESIVTSKALGRRRPTVCRPASLLASSSPMLYTKPGLKRVPRT